jgi:hypothetical protein
VTSLTTTSAMHRPLVALIFALTAVAPTAGAQPAGRPPDATYTYTPVDVPGATSTAVWGVNTAGRVAGSYWLSQTGPGFGLITSGGAFTAVQAPGARFTNFYGLNDAGQAVGRAYDGPSAGSFLYAGGAFTPIAAPGATSTEAWGINQAGHVVGSASFSSGPDVRGFVYAGGAYRLIDVPGALRTYAYGINSFGHVVGIYVTGAASYSFVYADGAFTTIGVPGYRTHLFGINDAGQLAGSYWDVFNQREYGFVYSGGAFATVDVPGAKHTYARTLNAAGQVAGDYTDARGASHGFVATPTAVVPEPATLTLAACGVLALAAIAARRRA